MRMHWGATIAVAVVAQTVAARPAAAQDENALRAAFEGRSITLRVDMPATSQGVDVFPQESMPVDFREVADRLKRYGTAVRTGQPVMITKVVIKKNSHIEFQLGGGGYGTFGDWMSNGSDVSAVSAGESKQERDLRDAMKSASGDDKKRMQRELDGLRSARERENGRAAADAQQANLAREASLHGKRLEAGSRFNIRYKHGIPPEGLTPEGVARALATYADFTNVPAVAGALAASAASAPSATTATGPGAPAGSMAGMPRAFAASTGSGARGAAPTTTGIGALRKGLTLTEVEAILGPATTAAEEKDGSMTITKRTYRQPGTQVAARFISDVLVTYTITPQ